MLTRLKFNVSLTKKITNTFLAKSRKNQHLLIICLQK